MNSPATRKTVDALTKTSRKPKNATIKRHRGLHPPEVAHLLPKIPLAIQHPNDESTYSDLTDSSSYAEYAWAFLRRNRFYQQLCDKKNDFSLPDWGFETRTGEWSHGVTSIKPYREPYSRKSGPDIRPRWVGIDSFAMQLRLLPTQQRGHSAGRLQVEYPKEQIAIVFDLAPLLAGHSVVDIQLQLAREKLLAMTAPPEKSEKKRSSTGATNPRTREYAPSKKLLRAQLRLADLLSGPHALEAAEEPDPNSPAAKATAKALARLSETYTRAKSPSLKISDIIDLIPSYDLKRGVAKVQPSRDQRINRASELITAAYLNIYRWEMLGLLQYDFWGEART